MRNDKIIFVPNAWVKCIYEGKICLGRTFNGKSTSVEAPQLISLTFESGEQNLVEFSLVRKVVILKILTVTQFETEYSFGAKVNSSGRINSLNKSLANYQLKTSMS